MKGSRNTILHNVAIAIIKPTLMAVNATFKVPLSKKEVEEIVNNLTKTRKELT
jgi:hypothetical protein